MSILGELPGMEQQASGQALRWSPRKVNDDADGAPPRNFGLTVARADEGQWDFVRHRCRVQAVAAAMSAGPSGPAI